MFECKQRKSRCKWVASFQNAESMSAKGEVIVASMISVRAMALAAGCVFQENRALSSDLCSGARRIGRWRIGGGRQEVEEGLVEQQAGRQEVVGQVSNPKLRQIRGGGG